MDLKAIGQKIRAIRRARGLSSVEVAELAGLSQSTISNFENGNRPITLETLQKICCALDIDIADLFLQEDLPPELIRLLSVAKQLTSEEANHLVSMFESIFHRR